MSHAQTPRFHMDVLSIDADKEIQRICELIRTTISRTFRKKGAVVAVSGGIDSSVTAALCARALGPERVLGLLLPERESSRETVELSNLLADSLGIEKVTEDITGILEAAGCYRKRNEAIRLVLPEYGEDWKAKIVLPSMLENQGYNLFHLVALSPAGEEVRKRLSYEAYLGIVAASNFKQRSRAMMTYHYADARNYSVVGTSNLQESDQGFFVKLGDGAADLKPIVHLYKSQIYQLATALGVPEAIRKRPPTPDTYPLAHTAEEFFFSLPIEMLDLCLYAEKNAIPAEEVARVLELTGEQVQRVMANIRQKRRSTEYLRQTVSLP